MWKSTKPDDPSNDNSSASNHGEALSHPQSRHAHWGGEDKIEKVDSEDKPIITEDECYEELGFSFSTTKKWTILTIIFLVQVSMNFVRVFAFLACFAFPCGFDDVGN